MSSTLIQKWAQSIFCSTCANTLSEWLRMSTTSSHMPFGVPMIWRETMDHVTDCYFCMTNVRGFNFKTRKSIAYPNVNSELKPLQHDPISCPVPVPPMEYSFEDTLDNMLSDEECDSDSDYKLNNDVYLINYAELCDLVRDLALTKGQAEVFGSRLREFNLLPPGTLTITFRYQQKALFSTLIRVTLSLTARMLMAS
mgnify:CR=1 FL=1